MPPAPARTVPGVTADDDIAAVVHRCRTVLGDPASWEAPAGYPDSLALCTLDAIWSIGIRYSTVMGVVGRYRDAVEGADTHGLEDLLRAIDEAGGTEAWRRQIGTRHRTSPRGGISKADAVAQAAAALVALDLISTQDLRQATPERLDDAERAWRAVRGQRSGVSWHYLLLLAGFDDVKADRMVIAFLRRAVPSVPDPPAARALVLAAAAEMQVSPRTLDHRIWRHQSGRLRPRSRTNGTAEELAHPAGPR